MKGLIGIFALWEAHEQKEALEISLREGHEWKEDHERLISSIDTFGPLSPPLSGRSFRGLLHPDICYLSIFFYFIETLFR